MPRVVPCWRVGWARNGLRGWWGWPPRSRSTSTSRAHRSTAGSASWCSTAWATAPMAPWHRPSHPPAPMPPSPPPPPPRSPPPAARWATWPNPAIEAQRPGSAGPCCIALLHTPLPQAGARVSAGQAVPPRPAMDDMEFELDRDYVELNQLLKLAGLCDSGGAGKALVASGCVHVDGAPELRKTRKIRAGETVSVDAASIRVVAS